MNSYRKRQQTQKVILVIFAFVLLPILLTYLNYQFSVHNPGGNDFLARWNGARLWVKEGINPYSDEVSLSTQKMIYGRAADVAKGEDPNQFVYPLYSMIFFAPLGLLEYNLARAIFMTILEFCMGAICIVSLKITDWKVNKTTLVGLIFFSIGWYSSVRTIILGQFSGMNALLMLLAILAIQNQQDALAGFLLVLSTSKPQMSYLLVIYVLWWGITQKRWTLVWSMVISFAAVVLLSLAFLPAWPLDWLRQMVAYPEYTHRIGSTLSIIAGWMPGIEGTLNLFLHLGFYLYLLVEWHRSQGQDSPAFVWTAFMTLAITNLVAYRTATPHYVVLLGPLFLICKTLEERWDRNGQMVNLAIFLTLFIGEWALFLSTVHGAEEAPVMYLPMPFLALIALWWTRWWTIKPIHRFFEENQE